MGTQAGTDQAESGTDTLQAVCPLNGSGISTTKLVMIYLSQWMFSTMQRIWVFWNGILCLRICNA